MVFLTANNSLQGFQVINMELYIETLTGVAFELRVSPFETVMSVKAKIQRLEGKQRNLCSGKWKSKYLLLSSILLNI